MAITGTGFDGTMDEAQFSVLMALAGARYTVGSTADFAATQVSGQRSVSISAGIAYAAGVTAISADAIVLDFAAPSAGQWNLGVLRRTWATNMREVVVVAGSTTSATTPTARPSLYPTINSTPGVVDDQPLWWFWVSAAATTVVMFDERTLRAALGDSGDIVPTLENNYDNMNLVCRGLNGYGSISGEFLRKDGGAFASSLLFNIPKRLRPKRRLRKSMEGLFGQESGQVLIESGGDVYVSSNAPRSASPGHFIDAIWPL